MNKDPRLVVIFEDTHLLVLDKPPGLLTQPSGTDGESLEQIAKEWLKEKYQKPGNVFLEAVHRIDKRVSGIVVFAKTSKALARLNACMRERQTKKIYEASVEGIPEIEEMVLVHYLVHEDFKSTVSTHKNPNAKEARLNYKVISRSDQFSRLEIELETGRYHQIRVQLAAIGCPIRGDFKYGAKSGFDNENPDVIALHSRLLGISHPISKMFMVFESSPVW